MGGAITGLLLFYRHTESTESTEMVGSPAARNLTNLVQILQNYI